MGRYAARSFGQGLQYAQNIYDRDRYRAIQDLMIEMLAYATVICMPVTAGASPTPLPRGEAKQPPILIATAASRTLEPNQVLILLAARPTGAQWLCPPL
jgi:hypothetical protein